MKANTTATKRAHDPRFRVGHVYPAPRDLPPACRAATHGRCDHHPSRRPVATIGLSVLCVECRDHQQAAHDQGPNPAI